MNDIYYCGECSIIIATTPSDFIDRSFAIESRCNDCIETVDGALVKYQRLLKEAVSSS